MAGNGATTAGIERRSNTRSGELERERWRRFWRQLLAARTIGAIGLCTFLALLPSLGTSRVAVAVAALVVVAGQNTWMYLRVRRDRSIRWHLTLCDTGTALIVVALVPSTYSPGALLLVSMSAFSVYWLGGRRAVLVMAPITVALFAIGMWHQPAGWFPTFVCWTATATIGTAAISRMSSVTMALRQRYDDMVNGIDALVWEGTGPVGDAEYMSERSTDLLGHEAADLASLTYLASRVHTDDVTAFTESRRRVAAGNDVEVHYRLRDRDGEYHHLHERISVVLDQDHRVLRRRGIMVDETARWLAEDSVRRFSDFIEGVPIAMAILRLEDREDATSLRVVISNPAAAAIAGVDENPTGRRVAELLPQAAPLLERLADVARLGQPLERPFLEIGDTGQVYALRAIPLEDHCVGLALEDVTKRARLAESLRHQALHDHLTGLPNRARFNERLGGVLRRAQLDDHRTALLLMDLNRFKDVNDSLGHEVGDRLLVELARRLSRRLRNCDTIARLGGDEFAVLITDVDSEARVLGVAERLVELCAEPFDLGDCRLEVGASVGVAIAPEHTDDPPALVRLADAAMYRAKASGGGIVFHAEDPGGSGSVTKIDLLKDLRAAVDSDALVVHYQPRLDLATLRPVGVEALVRWHHPRHGLLPPASFIELAEVSGTIELLARLVTERATADIHALAPGAGLAVNVNLSARNLRDPLLIDWVLDLLRRSEFPADSLCFELTEPQLLEDPGATLETLHGLRLLGVRLSIDDFGTGYSSLPYLRELPVDEVKLDRRFVADLEAGDSTIARSVVDLGHNLGLAVVAEGVESRLALELLRDMGCDSAQGFHLAAPMPVDDLQHYLVNPAPVTQRAVT